MAKKVKVKDKAAAAGHEPMSRKDYEAALEKLHVELVKLQQWGAQRPETHHRFQRS